jgi:aminoglycoside phosphotransferase
MDLPIAPPQPMARLLAGHRWQRMDHGGNTGRVFCLTAPDGVRQYLKICPCNDPIVSLARERDVLEWLAERVRVPRVLNYYCGERAEYLLLSEVPGCTLIDPAIDADSLKVAQSLARALRRLHAIEIANCPFNRRLEVTLREAARIVAPAPPDERLDARRAPPEDLVFAHGDYCLPNILIDDASGEFGFVDLGRAGVADRYLDLASAAHTLRYNDHDEDAVAAFFATYGLEFYDPAKLEFYTLLNKIL